MYDESLYKILPDELIKDIGIYAGFQHVREIRLRTGRLPAAICDMHMNPAWQMDF